MDTILEAVSARRSQGRSKAKFFARSLAVVPSQWALDVEWLRSTTLSNRDKGKRQKMLQEKNRTKPVLRNFSIRDELLLMLDYIEENHSTLLDLTLEN